MVKTLDSDLKERLRAVLGDRRVTEADLRRLAEEGRACALILRAQLAKREQALTGLSADPASSLSEIAEALTWLTDFRLVTRADGSWRTNTDPWELLLRGLEERRRREIDPALDLLRGCQSEMAADAAEGKTASTQIAKMIALVEDLAAIDVQARRLSPQTLRRLVGLGGRVGRLINRTLRTGDQG